MHPKILQFSNETFYGSRITTAAQAIQGIPDVESPFLFVDVTGMTSEEREGTSYKNSYEAATILYTLMNDDDILRVLKADPSSRIIVISPYKAQIRLLKKEMKKYRSQLQNVDVATVDSFQGQEGMIVIFSTVRTTRADFLDRNRINVALTRARLVLRVVGDRKLFEGLSSPSPLLDLAKFVKKLGLLADSKLDVAWRRPDWTTVTRFQPTMTARFHHCLQEMEKIDRNIAFNTLLAIVEPNFEKLISAPHSEKPKWLFSSLKMYREMMVVVWVPKTYTPASTGDQYYDGVAEAHFAGPRHACLEFVQKYAHLPKGTRGVQSNLAEGSMEVIQTDIADAPRASELDLSWLLTNELQDAIHDETISELPEGLFKLDPEQQRIVQRNPPLLIESRSGTGKTNVLFW